MLDLLTWTSGGRKGEIASMYVLPASFPVSSPSSFPLVFPPPISSPSKRIMFCRCAANAESSFRAQTCSAPVQNVQSYSFFPLHLWMDVALWYLYCVQCCISVFMTRGAAHGRTGSLDLSLWRIYDGCHGGWPPPSLFWMTKNVLKWKSEVCESENVNLMFLPQNKWMLLGGFLCA